MFLHGTQDVLTETHPEVYRQGQIMPRDETSLGSVIKEARQRDKLNLRGLAAESGVSLAQLSRIERNQAKRPSYSTLGGIARALHRSLDILLVLAGHVSLDQVRVTLDRSLPQAAALFRRSAEELERLLAETGSLEEDSSSARELRAILAGAFLDAVDVQPLLQLAYDRAALSPPDDPWWELSSPRYYERQTLSKALPEGFVAEKPESSRDFRAVREHWVYLSIGRREHVRAFTEDQRRLSELERLESPSRARRLDRARVLKEEVARLRTEIDGWRRRCEGLEARASRLEEELAQSQGTAVLRVDDAQRELPGAEADQRHPPLEITRDEDGERWGLKPAETRNLLREYRRYGTPELRDRLIDMYSPLVRYVAVLVGGALSAAVDIEDLVSYGRRGLISAIDRYGPDWEMEFERFAISRIRASIVSESRALNATARVDPTSFVPVSDAIQLAIATVEPKLGRAPTDEAIIAEVRANELLRHPPFFDQDEWWHATSKTSRAASEQKPPEATPPLKPVKGGEH
jgi:transcriptional regulator with XRE-family HTH domain